MSHCLAVFPVARDVDADVPLPAHDVPDGRSQLLLKAVLVDYARSHPECRVLPGRFMVIEQAMALPRGRPLAARYLREFVDEMKASGFVAASLAKSGQKDAAVAP